jgi:hypothetical protein
VIIKEETLWKKFCLCNLWCLQVTEIPEERRITVFKRGIPNGLTALIPIGGQIKPISIQGTVLLWKNPQKKPAKNITSDRINRIIPILKASWKKIVCLPLKLPSRIRSRLHW